MREVGTVAVKKTGARECNVIRGLEFRFRFGFFNACVRSYPNSLNCKTLNAKPKRYK